MYVSHGYENMSRERECASGTHTLRGPMVSERQMQVNKWYIERLANYNLPQPHSAHSLLVSIYPSFPLASYQRTVSQSSVNYCL